MGRALLAVGSFLVLCIVALIVSVVLTRGEETYAVDNLLAENLSREVATAEDNSKLVDVAGVTGFEWDTLLLVAEDTPRERLEEALGEEFQGSLNYDVESSELFVFLRDGELVRFADYRGLGRFAGVDKPIARMTPEEAVFEVED
ncbi:MAG: hypothetical protein AVDCRST_MAG69-2052, partial [uncultured Solirubrobacteraceae bacterium]